MNDRYERTLAIVETLRADVDFELDDVISKIVQGLPEDYFVTLSASDQLKPLKALLAMGICHLDDEIMMRSDDGQKVVVVANRNYPGQLADILKRLPDSHGLIGAKIFTSRDHDFIIDVFEFETARIESAAVTGLEVLIDTVAELTGCVRGDVQEFVSHYHPASPILSSAKRIADHLLAFREIGQTETLAIRWSVTSDQSRTRITVSSASEDDARVLLRRVSEYLGKQDLDIEQAWLHDIPIAPESRSHVTIVSFLIDGVVKDQSQNLQQFLEV